MILVRYLKALAVDKPLLYNALQRSYRPVLLKDNNFSNTNMGDEMCATCGSLADGFKCEECGEEQPELDQDHVCGVDHMMPKCSVCDEAETACTCDGM